MNHELKPEFVAPFFWLKYADLDSEGFDFVANLAFSQVLAESMGCLTRRDLCKFWTGWFEGYMEFEIECGRLAFRAGIPFEVNAYHVRLGDCPASRAYSYGWLREKNASRRN